MALDDGIFVAIVQVCGESIDVRMVGRVVPPVQSATLPAPFPVIGVIPIL